MRISLWPNSSWLVQVEADSATAQILDTVASAPAGLAGEGVARGLRGWIESVSGMGLETQNHVILSVLAVFLVYGTRSLIVRIVDRKVDDPKLLYQWSKSSSYAALVLSLLVVGGIWIEGLRQLGTFLGLLSAGLAIALKDVVASFAGWVFILWRRPFHLGDRIQIGGRAGDVVDIRPFQFTLMEIGNWVDADQSTGRIIHIPNAFVFTEALSNYTAQFGFIWNEVPVLVTFESNWKKAKEILQGILDERMTGVVAEAERAMLTASKKFLIYFRKLTPKVYTSVEDSGVLLTLRFICRVRERRGTTEELWEAILEAFGEASDIDLAYPTTRMYHNLLEGKGALRGELPPALGGHPDGGADGMGG